MWNTEARPFVPSSVSSFRKPTIGARIVLGIVEPGHLHVGAVVDHPHAGDHVLGWRRQPRPRYSQLLTSVSRSARFVVPVYAAVPEHAGGEDGVTGQPDHV